MSRIRCSLIVNVAKKSNVSKDIEKYLKNLLVHKKQWKNTWPSKLTRTCLKLRWENLCMKILRRCKLDQKDSLKKEKMKLWLKKFKIKAHMMKFKNERRNWLTLDIETGLVLIFIMTISINQWITGQCQVFHQRNCPAKKINLWCKMLKRSILEIIAQSKQEQLNCDFNF